MRAASRGFFEAVGIGVDRAISAWWTSRSDEGDGAGIRVALSPRFDRNPQIDGFDAKDVEPSQRSATMGP
jgi:hypothetical protein